MIKINKSTKIALYAVFELSKDTKKILSVGQIAEKYQVSEHHAVKVLQNLSRAGVVRSIRGINGGFQIAKNPKDLTVLDVIEIFEQVDPATNCVLLDSNENCPQDGTCKIGELFDEVNELVYYTFKSVSFATLISSKGII